MIEDILNLVLHTPSYKVIMSQMKMTFVTIGNEGKSDNNDKLCDCLIFKKDVLPRTLWFLFHFLQCFQLL
jgi:hypothetical protein